MVLRRTLSIVLLAIAASALIGILAAQRLSPRAEAHLWPGTNPGDHTQLYSFSSNNCMTRVDPVTIVFYNAATTQNVHSHANHHGWTYHDNLGSTQHFFEHACASQDDQSADGAFVDFNGRFHMRNTRNGDIDYLMGEYSIATPHHEFNDPDPDCLGAHAVKANQDDNDMSDGYGGFAEGREEVCLDFVVNSDHHYFGGNRGWDNMEMMEQCNGKMAWNDGFVHLIQILP
jgi:hypothetical protein